MAFKHSITFTTNLAANFGCNQFRITPDIVSKLLLAAIWSRCAVWFRYEQTPFPQIGCRYRPAALHRIRFGTWGFGQHQLLADSMEISFHNFLMWNSHQKKKCLIAAQNFKVQSIKNLFARVACFPQASWSWPTATASNWDMETPCGCARPSDQRKQSQMAAPRAWQLILPSKPLITFWNSLWRDCQMTGRGSNLDSNLNSAAWPTSCKGFIASEITA